MKFREMALKDLNLFFDEMADMHEVDEVEIQVIVDTEELHDRQTIGNVMISEATTLILIRTEDVPKHKSIGDTLTFDGRVKMIDQWNEVDGITEIMLSDNGGIA